LTVFRLLNKQKTDLVKAIGDLLPCGPGDAYKVAEALAQLPDHEVFRVLADMPELHVRHLPGAATTLQKIGVTLLGLILDTKGSAVSAADSAPVQLSTPAFDSAESRGIFSELVHATFRGWTPHFRVTEDLSTIEPAGWRMVSEAVEDPLSWNAQDHFKELVNCIVAAQPSLIRSSNLTPRLLAKSKARATHVQASIQEADRLPRAKAILLSQFHKQMCLMLETDDNSPLRNPAVQDKMKQEFGDLLTLVFSDASQDQEPLRGPIQNIQVAAQSFLGTLFTQQGSP
jgi:hypothetical protein